jgi:hydrogenase maturation protease
MIEVSVREAPDGWSRVSVRISNCGAFDVPAIDSAAWPTREAALRRSLVSTHAILCVPGGEFASLLDPPEELRQLSAECSNVGLWPVLAGDAPDTMLASPIILYDYPQIAPESAGALFDGTEIDEILSLRILALTDDEKREMRETDPQARRLLERTEALDPEQWLQLHGVMRDPQRSGSGQ